MLYATTCFQIWLEKLSVTSRQRSALSRLRTRGTTDQSALTVARTSEISFSQQKVRVNKQMNPPEIKDIGVSHHNEDENSAKEDVVKGNQEVDVQVPSQKRKRTEGPSTPPLTPKKRLCSEAKKKELEEVPAVVQTTSDQDETKVLTRRTLPSRNVVKDNTKDLEGDKSNPCLVDIKTIKKPGDSNKESPKTASSCNHREPYVLLPKLKQSESQPREEVSVEPTLKSRTRSRTAKDTEEEENLPTKNQQETTPSATALNLQILPKQVSHRLTETKVEETKITNELPKQETLPLRKRRTVVRDLSPPDPKGPPTSDEVDVVSRRFRTRASEGVSKEEVPDKSPESQLGKKNGEPKEKEEHPVSQQKGNPSSAPTTTSKLRKRETNKQTDRPPEPVIADLGLGKETEKTASSRLMRKTTKPSETTICRADTSDKDVGQAKQDVETKPTKITENLPNPPL